MPPRDGDARAALRERARDREPEAPPAAGDERAATPELGPGREALGELDGDAGVRRRFCPLALPAQITTPSPGRLSRRRATMTNTR